MGKICLEASRLALVLADYWQNNTNEQDYAQKHYFDTTIKFLIKFGLVHQFGGIQVSGGKKKRKLNLCEPCSSLGS